MAKSLVPDSFKLLGRKWTVEKQAGLSEYGRCDNETATIYIRSKLPTDTEALTFFHELIHAIKYSSGETTTHDEKEVELFGALLHQYTVTRA
jgi:hypothetical protein